jgi:hypothetical protein
MKSRVGLLLIVGSLGKRHRTLKPIRLGHCRSVMRPPHQDRFPLPMPSESFATEALTIEEGDHLKKPIRGGLVEKAPIGSIFTRNTLVFIIGTHERARQLSWRSPANPADLTSKCDGLNGRSMCALIR